MTVLVLDTCEIHRNFKLSGARLVSLLTFCQESNIKVVLPTPVFEEHIGDYRERLAEEFNAIKRFEALSRIVVRVEIKVSTLEDIEKEYREYVQKWVANCGWIQPVPNGFESEILKKMVARKKPFKADRTGYPDALTWLTVLQLGKTNEVHFVSSNTKDFSRDGILHPDLLAEIEEKKGELKAIHYYPGLGKYFDDFVIPIQKKNEVWRSELEKMESDLEAGSYDGLNLLSWISDSFDAIEKDFIGMDVGVPQAFEDVEYAELIDAFDISNVSVSFGKSELMLIRFDVGIFAAYHALAEEEDIYDGYGDTEYEVQSIVEDDSRWWTRSFHIRGTISFSTSIACNFDPATKEITNAEIVSMSRS